MSRTVTSSIPSPIASKRFFADQGFHFQTLRALMTALSGGADLGEVLETVARIRDGDVDSWFTEWTALGDRTERVARQARDRRNRGHALMRAHTYHRTAAFYLPPSDPRRPASWDRNVDCFDGALSALEIRHERFRATYPGGGLQAIHYPARVDSNDRPLLVCVGGFDSTLEELYLMLGPAAYERGYPLLTYEGPGQGAALRTQGLHFTPHWEEPNSAVLDAFFATHGKPRRTVLVGMSMGGYLAPRAAAFDRRIDGVVTWNTLYDLAAAAAPLLGVARSDGPMSVEAAWGVANARWTFGVDSMDAMRTELERYTLADVASRIRQDVLLILGEADHFVPAQQTDDFARALVNARSVTVRSFDRLSGGAEHCQSGNATSAHLAIFDWLEATFGDRPNQVQHEE
jgi:dienelactone hydrolase